MINYRKIAESIFLTGVESVLPDKLIRQQMRVQGDDLCISRLNLNVRSIHNIYVIGAGKASAFMAKGVEAILGNRITEGHIVVKYGHGCALQGIKLTGAGHPTPDANGFKGTAEILRVAEKATDDDLVLCLLSGGGSALIADCPDTAKPEDLMKMNQLLVHCGASITEINTVRKHLSKVKGGQLARAVQPAKLVTLILSDVIGDPLDVIASGPTVPDTSTFQDALHVLEKFRIVCDMPPVLVKHLYDGIDGKHPETPKINDPVFINTHNVIIGNNQMALQASFKKAKGLGFDTRIGGAALSGDSAAAAKAIVNSALMVQADPAMTNNVCLLFGGETTIKVTGAGLGGRNQHLALVAAMELKNIPGITLLSAGTDGNDGPTDATGAVVDFQTISEVMTDEIDLERYLKGFDSYHFFKRVGGHIITGPTMTNVMDMVVVLIEKPNFIKRRQERN